MDHNMFKKASDIIAQCEEGYFAYMDGNGYPHTATRSKMRSEDISVCWFSTNTSGSMAQSIMKDSRASVCFRLEGDNVTLIGDAYIVEDMKVKESLWLDWFINHYPGGVSDPEYCVVRFETAEVSLWVDQQVVKSDLATIREITSRCGLLCQTCTFKEPYNCKGCIASMGHPFHGECPIALCAQTKGYEHCGLCPDMPCDQLKAYSCGDGEHCDRPKGARLEMLKMWERRQ